METEVAWELGVSRWPTMRCNPPKFCSAQANNALCPSEHGQLMATLCSHPRAPPPAARIAA